MDRSEVFSQREDDDREDDACGGCFCPSAACLLVYPRLHPRPPNTLLLFEGSKAAALGTFRMGGTHRV